MDSVVSVGEFVALLNQTLEFAYPAVKIEGEVSGYSGPNRNGHHYFTLKDAEAQMKTVAFRGTVNNPIEDGMKVIVNGSPSHHARYGFSFIARSVTPSGEGDIKRAQEMLRKQLEKEGLFDEERKRSLPRFPQRIGVVSSAQAAGYADFIKIVNARWSGVDILLADVQVQGDPAVKQIVGAINYFNQLNNIDVLVVTRGGGSLEDLQAFSAEPVVRAVAASRIPTVVAVGHETDISLSDLAADQRASTPTDAARLIVPDKRELLQTIDHLTSKIEQRTDNWFSQSEHRLQRASSHIAQFIERPLGIVERSQRQLTARIDQTLDRDRQRRAHLERLLVSFNPRDVLRRGYALVKREGKTVRSASQLRAGQRLVLELSDGTVNTEVVNGKKDKK